MNKNRQWRNRIHQQHCEKIRLRKIEKASRSGGYSGTEEEQISSSLALFFQSPKQWRVLQKVRQPFVKRVYRQQKKG